MGYSTEALVPAVWGSFLSTSDCSPSWIVAGLVLHTLWPSAVPQDGHELEYAAESPLLSTCVCVGVCVCVCVCVCARMREKRWNYNDSQQCYHLAWQWNCRKSCSCYRDYWWHCHNWGQRPQSLQKHVLKIIQSVAVCLLNHTTIQALLKPPQETQCPDSILTPGTLSH